MLFQSVRISASAILLSVVTASLLLSPLASHWLDELPASGAATREIILLFVCFVTTSLSIYLLILNWQKSRNDQDVSASVAESAVDNPVSSKPESQAAPITNNDRDDASAKQFRQFNPDKLVEYLGDDQSIHKSILNTFLLQVPDTFKCMQQSLTSDNRARLKSFAHQLKSSGWSVGATDLGERCQALESFCENISEEQVKILIDEIEIELSILRREIKQYLQAEALDQADTGQFTALNVLVVDDDLFSTQMLRASLTQLGVAEVYAYQSAQTALDLLKANTKKIDLILVDLNMPNIDGIEFLRLLSEQNFTDAVGIISGAGSRLLHTTQLLAAEHRLNIIGGLEKPIQISALCSLLNAFNPVDSFCTQFAPLSEISEGDLRRAVNQKQFEMCYQPKLNMNSGQVESIEALVRWHHPEKGQLYPEQFIAVSERTGLISDITEQTLHQALSCLSKLRQAGHQITMAVNFSVELLTNLDWPDQIEQMLKRYKLQPSDLILELTERGIMANMIASLEVLNRLSLKQIRLSIDDFGTGYSSLEQLQRVPFSEMKIDRTFVAHARGDNSARAIVSSSVDLARKLDLTLVAEGIETASDWQLMSELGCEQAQGYFVARAMKADQLFDWLSDRRAAATGDDQLSVITGAAERPSA